MSKKSISTSSLEMSHPRLEPYASEQFTTRQGKQFIADQLTLSIQKEVSKASRISALFPTPQ
jgi:hypothetical protein